MKLAHVTLVVQEYDEAIRFYVEKLGFKLLEDTALAALASSREHPPPGGCTITHRLAGDNAEQVSRVGNQTGGRVLLFLHTDDFQRDYGRLVANGVKFVRPPRTEAYGTVAVFEDIYGNWWDLVEPITRS